MSSKRRKVSKEISSDRDEESVLQSGSPKKLSIEGIACEITDALYLTQQRHKSDDEYEYVEEEEEEPDVVSRTMNEDFTEETEVTETKLIPEISNEHSEEEQDRESRIDTQLNELVNEGLPPDDDIRDDVLHALNRKKVAALCESDYDLAQKYEDAIQTIISNENNSLIRSRDCHDAETRSWRADTIRQKLRDTTDKYNEIIGRNEEECDARIRQLEELHDAEIREFKAKWQNPEFLKTFSRPSPKMLQMRHIEKKLAIQKKYMEAKQMKLIADKQQKLEEDEMQQIVLNQMRSDYQKMMERHKRELDKVEEFYNASNVKVQLKMNQTVNGLQIALRATETPKVETEMHKRWKTASRDLTAGATAVPTPRTQQRYLQYKGERNASLRISPVRDDVLSRLPVPKSRAGSRTMTRSSLTAIL